VSTCECMCMYVRIYICMNEYMYVCIMYYVCMYILCMYVYIYIFM